MKFSGPGMVVLGVGLLAGCATPPPVTPPAAALPASLPVIVARYERRLADGRLEIVAKLKNPGTTAASAHVACDFMDGDGHPLALAPETLSVTLAPGEILTVHFDADKTAAAVAIVSLRPD